MKRIGILLMILVAGGLGAVDFYIGAQGGFAQGGGGGLEVSVIDITENYPLSVKAGIGYFTNKDPGNAEAARRIFINDNQGGDIKKEGQNWLYWADLGWTFYENEQIQLDLFGGGRYSTFAAYFEYAGDNEAFYARTEAYGLGGGGEVRFFLNPRYYLSLAAGVDGFFKSHLYGHGQFSYNPEGVDDNPRNDYTYEDADEAVNQPDFIPRVTLGIHYIIQ